jgi:hypothetical protein
MNKISSSHTEGLDFAIQEPPQKHAPTTRLFLTTVAVLVTFLSLYCISEGGTVSLQLLGFSLTFSGQSQPK